MVVVDPGAGVPTAISAEAVVGGTSITRSSMNVVYATPLETADPTRLTEAIVVTGTAASPSRNGDGK